MINPFCKYTKPELIEVYEQGVKDTKDALKDLLIKTGIEYSNVGQNC